MPEKKEPATRDRPQPKAKEPEEEEEPRQEQPEAPREAPAAARGVTPRPLWQHRYDGKAPGRK